MTATAPAASPEHLNQLMIDAIAAARHGRHQRPPRPGRDPRRAAPRLRPRRQPRRCLQPRPCRDHQAGHRGEIAVVRLGALPRRRHARAARRPRRPPRLRGRSREPGGTPRCSPPSPGQAGTSPPSTSTRRSPPRQQPTSNEPGSPACTSPPGTRASACRRTPRTTGPSSPSAASTSRRPGSASSGPAGGWSCRCAGAARPSRVALVLGEDGLLRSDSVFLCGFVPMIGQDSERSAALDSRDLVHLYWDADQGYLTRPTVSASSTHRKRASTPVPRSAPWSPSTPIRARATATDPAVCRISVEPAAITSGLCTPVVKSRTLALAEGDSIAYLAVQRLQTPEPSFRTGCHRARPLQRRQPRGTTLPPHRHLGRRPRSRSRASPSTRTGLCARHPRRAGHHARTLRNDRRLLTGTRRRQQTPTPSPPARLTGEAAARPVSGALRPSGNRCVSSIREITDADGRQVASNEVWAPGPDRRAVPSVPVRAATMEELAAAGYRPGPWQAP